MLLLALAMSFVQVQGPDFVLDGKPFHFVGANLRVMHGQLWRGRYEEVLDAAAQDGLKVGRIWALGEGEPDAEPWRKSYDLFRAGPEGWIEDAYLQLDRVLVAARKRGLRLIVTLSNNWKDYGGVPQYLRWRGVWDLEAEYGLQDLFYSDEQAWKQFEAHLLRLLHRRNHIDGTPYTEEPAIFAWELMNESVVQTEEGRNHRRTFIQRAAKLIKSVDKNHLVSAGLLGYRNQAERIDWMETLKLPEVDYCDAHLYVKDSLRVQTFADLDDVLDDQAQLARFAIGKPFILGEFGFPTRAGPFRDRPVIDWFNHLLERSRKNAIAGALVWIYQPKTPHSDEYAVFLDDPTGQVVRSALRSAAMKLTEVPLSGPSNPRLSATRGNEPFLDFHVTVRGRKEPLHDWRLLAKGGARLFLGPYDFSEARWENTGVWEGGTLIHAWGTQTGHFSFRFSPPPSQRSARVASVASAPPRLKLRIRLSSEFPGAVAPDSDRGFSRVRILLDGQQVTEIAAYPDDGIGRTYEIDLTAAWSRLRVTSRHGDAHTLTFEVPPDSSERDPAERGPSGRGLCIYGARGKGRLSEKEQWLAPEPSYLEWTESSELR